MDVAHVRAIPEKDPTATHELWLLPGEWYSAIPRGYLIWDINGRRETFVPGETDDDIRFGCLAFGIMVKL